MSISVKNSNDKANKGYYSVCIVVKGNNAETVFLKLKEFLEIGIYGLSCNQCPNNYDLEYSDLFTCETWVFDTKKEFMNDIKRFVKHFKENKLIRY